MKNKTVLKKSFVSKLFVKIIRKFGYEVVDQANLNLPIKDKDINQNLSESGKRNITIPLGVINIKNSRHQDDPRPIDENCSCPACRNYSRAYLHHVFKSQEIISSMLLTWHNLQYYQDLMDCIRNAIRLNLFDKFVDKFFAFRAQGDIEPL